MSIATISPKELFNLSQSGAAVDLLDVRTPVEFRDVHIPFAHNVPLDQIDAARPPGGQARPDRPLYVICRTDNRSRQACEKLLDSGHPDVIRVEGGTDAWVRAGLPVVRGRKAVSLERQVRITAGVLVLTGSTLGAFVNPYWIGLAAFIGAGLTFSGVTDTCGMAMVLARMPWNRISRPGTRAP